MRARRQVEREEVGQRHRDAVQHLLERAHRRAYTVLLDQRNHAVRDARALRELALRHTVEGPDRAQVRADVDAGFGHGVQNPAQSWVNCGGFLAFVGRVSIFLIVRGRQERCRALPTSPQPSGARHVRATVWIAASSKPSGCVHATNQFKANPRLLARIGRTYGRGWAPGARRLRGFCGAERRSRAQGPGSQRRISFDGYAADQMDTRRR